MTKTATKPRKKRDPVYTDKVNKFRYSVTPSGERFHTAAKRMLSPIPGQEGMWGCFSYTSRTQPEYSYHGQDLPTAQAMVWLSAKHINPAMPEPKHALEASLTRSQAQYIKTLLENTDARTMNAIGAKAELHLALENMGLDLR